MLEAYKTEGPENHNHHDIGNEEPIKDTQPFTKCLNIV